MMWKALSDSKEVVDPLTSPNTNRTWIEALAEIILAYFFTLTGMLSLAPPKLRSPYMTRPLVTAAWPYNVTGPRYSYFHTPKELSLFLPNQRTKILAPCQNTIALQ